MSDPADDTNPPEPAAPESAESASAQVIKEPAAPEPAAPAPAAPEPAGQVITEPAEPVASEPVANPPVRGRNPALALGLVAIVAVAFGAGIGVGRATAPGGVEASPVAMATPGPSTSPGAPASAGASPGSSAGPSVTPTGIASLPSEGPRLGRADAKVIVDYWADYQCPFCAKFAEEVIPQLASRIADGTVALVHRDYAFLDFSAPGTESLDSAMAVRCAGREGRYWQMHDAVYAAQAGENQGAFARDRLALIAASVGVDPDAFEACMDDREPLVDVLDDTSTAIRTGISSTPTVEVNGARFQGVPDVAPLLAAIDAAAAGASPAPTPTAQPRGDPWTQVAAAGREAGSATAPVTVELWMDYQAAASGPVAASLGPELRSRVGAGAIRVVQRDLATLGDESILAAATVRCVARQGGPALLVHDALASSAQGPNQGIYNPRAILRFAARLGMDIGSLSDCLDDPSVAADVKAETAIGTGEGLVTAPSVIVRKGGREVARFSGELDVAKVLAAIDGGG